MNDDVGCLLGAIGIVIGIAIGIAIGRTTRHDELCTARLVAAHTAADSIAIYRDDSHCVPPVPR